jgi:phosphatidylserine/phosphatidylglycerophosphate/cardiolipin synthase-like enzyme
MRILLATVVVLAVCNLAAFARNWTDTTGKHAIEAEFVNVEDSSVRLKKEDGSIFTIPLEKLSEADRDWVTKADGYLGARFDVARGHYEEKGFGLPAQWVPNYVRLLRERYGIEYRAVAGCAVTEHNIAHNKSIVVDDSVVITGSFNFTENAEENAENLLVILDKDLAATYTTN